MIVFTRHVSAPRELEYVQRAVKSGVMSGDGPFTATASKMLGELHQGARVLMTTSCTHALELAALLLRLGPGDDVVMPSFTFSSTANAFALRGCSVRFADIDPGTFSMELPQLRVAVTPKTRVVVTVAYGGVLRDLEAIASFCTDRGITLVEDNAHGLFARVGGRPLGTFGQLSALSFHQTKNISCGEGGALVINDKLFELRAEILREKGTDRTRFWRGEVDKYTWRDIGSSYLPSDVLAAILVAQLENALVSQQRRQALWNFYREALGPSAEDLGVKMQEVPAEVEHPAHVFACVLPAHVDRAKLLAELGTRQVKAVSHYEPLHLAPAHQIAGQRAEELPVTETIAPRLVRLPLFAGMTLDQAHTVAMQLLSALTTVSRPRHRAAAEF